MPVLFLYTTRDCQPFNGSLAIIAERFRIQTHGFVPPAFAEFTFSLCTIYDITFI